MPRSRRPIAAMPVPSSNRLEGSGVTALNVYVGAPIARYALPSIVKDCVAVPRPRKRPYPPQISHPLNLPQRSARQLVRNCRHLTRGISAACRGTAISARTRRFTSDGSDKVRARVVSRTPRPRPPIHREIQPTASVITRSILANFTSLAKRRRSCTERDAQRLDIVEDDHESFRFRSGVEAAQRSQTDRRRRGCLGHRGPGGDARSWLCRHVRRRPVVRPANRHDLPGVSHRVPGADPVRAVVQAERLPD